MSVVGLALTLAVFMSPLAAEAQQAGKGYRFGLLGASTASAYAGWIEPLWQGLRDLGYEDGKNYVLEARWAEGKTDRLPALAAELVRLKPDLLITLGTGASKAAKGATQTLPIVMAGGSDPLGAKLIASLARPGGNITGTTSSNVELSGKRLELLAEIAPGGSRVAVLALADYPSTPLSLKDAQETGRGLGIPLLVQWVRRVEDLPGAFRAANRAQAGSLLILGGPLHTHNKQIAELALKNRMPAISAYRSFPDRGGLVSYGVSMGEPYRRAATYVDRILKGAKPADLPVEQPTKLEMVINLKTAKALGLTIPPAVLMRADEVIE